MIASKMWSYLPLLLFCAGIATFQSAVHGDPENPNQGIWSYRDQLARGQFDQAEKQIRTISRGSAVPKDQRWLLALDLLKAMRYQGREGDAEKFLARFGKQDLQRPELIAERTWLAMNQKQADFDGLLIELDKQQDEVSPIYAGYFHARQTFDAKQWEACIKLCRQASRRLNNAKLYRYPQQWEISRIRSDLNRLLKEATHFWIASKFGDDYANYRSGRVAQADHLYEDAIRCYRQIKAPILKEASLCYTAECLAKLDHDRDAVALWQKFIRTDETGLYRGEAMLRIGEILLCKNNDPNAASDWFAKCVQWCKDMRQVTPNVDAASINGILTAFPIPKERSGRDRFGNFHRHLAGPETIENRLTCTWYLDAVQADAMMLHAFSLNLMGRTDESLDVLTALVQLDQQNQGNLLQLGSLPERLLSDAGDGSFALPANITASLSKENSLNIQLAAFYYIAGERERANAILSSIHSKVVGKTSLTNDWAAVEFLLGCVAFENGDKDIAKGEFERFETVLKDSSLAPLAVLLSANIDAGDLDAYEDAKKRYLWVATEYAKTPLAPRALLSLVLAAQNAGQSDDAYEAWQHLVYGRYSDTLFAAAARTLEPRMAVHAEPEDEAQQPETDDKRGQIRPFQRHLVIPGHVDWAINTSAIQPFDIVEYRVSYEVRVGCAMKTLWYQMDVFEPQPPPTRQSPLQFLRAPVLAVPPT